MRRRTSKGIARGRFVGIPPKKIKHLVISTIRWGHPCCIRRPKRFSHGASFDLNEFGQLVNSSKTED
jgi:hypothetical protein